MCCALSPHTRAPAHTFTAYVATSIYLTKSTKLMLTTKFLDNYTQSEEKSNYKHVYIFHDSRFGLELVRWTEY